MRRWDVLTFDCYGTLIDWDRGIGDALEAAARAHGLALDRQALLDAYHEIEPVVEAETFRSYRAVLTETARRVAGRAGVELEEDRAGFLADTLRSWTPFPDTNPALDRLVAAGYRLGILSNVDDDLLAGTRRHFTVTFDPELIVTAQQVGAYKPAAPHFDTARRRIGGGRWLHVAQSFFHDIAPATALGIPAAWVNRKGEPTPPTALHLPQFPTLAALADWLVAE